MIDKETKFYQHLQHKLTQSFTWPSEYLYKFIVISDEQKIQAVLKCFDNMGAIINTKISGKGKYTSISVKAKMDNSDAVIKKYQQLAKIEGIISL